MNNNVRRTRDPDISLMSPAGVLLDQTVLRASFRWNFYFRTPDINGSSRGLSFILSRLSLCNSFVRFSRFACILLISRYTSETRPRRDGVVLLWHFNTYVHDDFLCRFFPGMLNFLIMRIFALQRKKSDDNVRDCTASPSWLQCLIFWDLLAYRRQKFAENIFASPPCIFDVLTD